MLTSPVKECHQPCDDIWCNDRPPMQRQTCHTLWLGDLVTVLLCSWGMIKLFNDTFLITCPHHLFSHDCVETQPQDPFCPSQSLLAHQGQRVYSMRTCWLLLPRRLNYWWGSLKTWLDKNRWGNEQLNHFFKGPGSSFSWGSSTLPVFSISRCLKKFFGIIIWDIWSVKITN